MRKHILIMTVFGVCMVDGAIAKLPPFVIGEFTAPKGATGATGAPGGTGAAGADGCPPLISSDTKDANGCFVVKQRAQVRNNGSCQATGSWTTIDTVCDCRPSESRVPCGHGGSEPACGTVGRTGYKITTTQCDGTGSTTSYIYDNDCGITVASVADVHQDNDLNKPITHKRVAFQDCNGTPLGTTADIPVGCTPTYTQKYINKVGNDSPTFNNDSRTENTIGTRVTVSGCGNSVDIDTYDGDDGTSFNFKGTKNTCSELQAITGAQANDAWLVKQDGLLYIYNGTNFPTCPNGGAAFQGPAGDNNCTGYETDPTAVKHTVRTYSEPSSSTVFNGVTVYAVRGEMVQTHTMCDGGADTTDSVYDQCTPIIKPSGVTCSGTYYECKPQGTYSGNNTYAKYNLCEATNGTTIESMLSNKEDNPCAGSNSGSTSIERTQTTAYVVPTGTSSTYNSATLYSGNGAAPGKVVTTSVKCNALGNAVIGTVQDRCVEITKSANVCTDTNKKFYQCKPQGKIGSDNNLTPYYLCATELEPSLLDLITTAQSGANAANPCASSPDSSTIIKSTTSTSYNRGTKSNNLYPGVGSKTVTKTACDGTTTYTTTEQDSCVEVAKPVGVCTATTSVYLRCYNDQVTSDKTYYVCQDLGNGNTALSNKIDSAVTVSALTNTLGTTYLRPNDSINASNLTGTIDAGRLPNTVVTTGDDEIHGFNTLIGNAVQTEVASQIQSSKLVSESDLETAVMGQTYTFAGQSMTVGEIVSMLNQAVGNCSTVARDGGVTETSCTGGNLGSMTIQRGGGNNGGSGLVTP